MSRKRLTAQDASVIWDHYQQAGDAAATSPARARGYSRSTYYKIMRNQGEISGQYLHPIRVNKWNAAQEAVAAQIIAHNPALTLSDVIHEAVAQGLPRIPAPTLHRYLTVLLITRKLMQTIPQMRNAPATKPDRQLYCRWVLANRHYEFVYIDEFGFQIGTQRRSRWSPIGQPAYRRAPLSRSANVSVYPAVGATYGLIYHDVNHGALNREGLVQAHRNYMLGRSPSVLAQQGAEKSDVNFVVLFSFCPPHPRRRALHGERWI
jgi:hypothetical protein